MGTHLVPLCSPDLVHTTTIPCLHGWLCTHTWLPATSRKQRTHQLTWLCVSRGNRARGGCCCHSPVLVQHHHVLHGQHKGARPCAHLHMFVPARVLVCTRSPSFVPTLVHLRPCLRPPACVCACACPCLHAPTLIRTCSCLHVSSFAHACPRLCLPLSAHILVCAHLHGLVGARCFVGMGAKGGVVMGAWGWVS
jgi:hypothetical protein